MRYIDTGTRDPDHALGCWLNEHVSQEAALKELRWQSGFFDAGCLGYFLPAMQALEHRDGILRVLIGSNDGMTRREDIEALLSTAGSVRKNRQIGIIRFQNAYFHPKTIHIVRDDGSTAAYVGSANLTTNGVASLHVEAGLLLDTLQGDDENTLADIAGAIDWWFAESRPGLYLIERSEQLDELVKKGILDIPAPTPPQLTGQQKFASFFTARLSPLLSVPQQQAPTETTSTKPVSPQTEQPGVSAKTPTPDLAQTKPSVSEARWWKRITRSDAQRKGTGNQRGSITLVQAGHPINAQTYFRRTFFDTTRWVPGATSTGARRESTLVPFRTIFLGTDLGILNIEITYAPNREAAQANYTSLLHLGPLASRFARTNLIGKYLILDKSADGQYTLSITDDAP